MSDPNLRTVGVVQGVGGERLVVGVDRGTVAIYLGDSLSGVKVRLRSGEAEIFAQLFVAASWEAAGQEPGDG